MFLDWLASLSSAHDAGELFTCFEQPLAGTGRALALAPHPDDPDAVAVTLRLLARGGWEVSWAIVTSGCSGVQDAFAGSLHARKSRGARGGTGGIGTPLRSARGTAALPAAGRGCDGELAETAENRMRFDAALRKLAPALVLLPCGADTDPTHRRVFTWFHDWMCNWPHPLTALYNEDPKSLAFSPRVRGDLRRRDGALESGVARMSPLAKRAQPGHPRHHLRRAHPGGEPRRHRAVGRDVYRAVSGGIPG